jgi:hypothetical protein
VQAPSRQHGSPSGGGAAAPSCCPNVLPPPVAHSTAPRPQALAAAAHPAGSPCSLTRARLVGSRVLRVRAPARPRCLAAQGGKGPRGDSRRRPARSLKKTSLSEDSFKRCPEPSCTAHGGGGGGGRGSVNVPNTRLGLPRRTLCLSPRARAPGALLFSAFLQESPRLGWPAGTWSPAPTPLHTHTPPHPSSAGPTSLHLPSTPLPHPHPPSLSSQGQPRRQGGRLGGILCPKLPLSAVHKHSTSQSRARAPASAHWNPPAKEPAQPCPPPPMRRSPLSFQNCTTHSFQGPLHSLDIVQSSPPLCSQHLHATLQEIPTVPTSP